MLIVDFIGMSLSTGQLLFAVGSPMLWIMLGYIPTLERAHLPLFSEILKLKDIARLESGDDVQRVWEYLHKSPEALHMGNMERPLRVQREVLSESRAWARIAEVRPISYNSQNSTLNHAVQAKSTEEFKELCFKLSPKTYFLEQEKWMKGATTHFEVKRPKWCSKRSREAFPHVSREMLEWVEVNLDVDECPERPLSLCVVGPSRIGKTEWARCLGASVHPRSLFILSDVMLGPHMYFHGLMNLADWDDAAEYIIFDDFDAKSFSSSYKAWFGAQKQFTVTDKYMKKQTVTWGKPMIWLSNDNPLDSGFFDRTWMESNTVVVNVRDKLFS